VTDVARKALAEFLGTALLVATVVGSGIAAQRLSPGDAGLQLLENALITGAVLVALILALGPVSAAFNPVGTLAERIFGAITTGEAAAFISAQIAGGAAGAVLANLMFGLPAVTISTHTRSAGGLWLGEVVATFGLLLVIFGVVRSGRGIHVAYAVGGYITAAYWFTSSTSFANPAVTVARTLSDTLRRDLARLGAGVRAHAAGRRRARHRRDPCPVPAGQRAGRRTDPSSNAVAGCRRRDHLAGGLSMSERPTVLYACVHNSGRSVAAKVLTEHDAGDRVDVRSAGSEPGKGVNPLVAHLSPSSSLAPLHPRMTMVSRHERCHGCRKLTQASLCLVPTSVGPVRDL